MIMTRREFWLQGVMAISSTWLAGCGDSRPVALAYLEDCTLSCENGRAQFHKEAEGLIRGGYLGEGAVSIIHGCTHPHLLFAGPARRAKAVQAALAQAVQPCPCNEAGCHCGSDPAGALLIARAWLGKPEFKDYRKIIVFWTDLEPDPCKAKGSLRAFADPLKA